MVETRRGSSSSKRPLSSSPPSNTKRSKVSQDASSTTLPSIPVKESAKRNESGKPDDIQQPSDLPETASLNVLDGANNDKFHSDPIQPNPQCPGESAEKPKVAAPVVSSRRKPRSVAKLIAKPAVWGKLISQSSQNPHLSISDPIFTVGQGRQSNLVLKDPTIGNVLCKLSHIEQQQGGSSVALLEITGGKGVVQVNGKTFRRTTKMILNGGDEHETQIFQLLKSNNVSTAGTPPSVSILEAQSAALNGMQVEARSGDPSAVAAKTCKKRSADISSLPSGHGDNVPDNEMKDTTNNDESAGVFSSGKVVPSSSTTVNENPSLDTMDVDADADTDVGKMTSANYELRPLLCMLTGSGTEFDLSGSIHKILEDQRELKQRILKADDIDV